MENFKDKRLWITIAVVIVAFYAAYAAGWIGG